MIRLALVLGIVLTASCREAREPSAEQRNGPLTSDGTLARELTMKPDLVKVKLDLAAVRTAIGVWRGEHDRLPGSLEELGVEGLHYPDDLNYQPATGEVTSASHPGL